MAKLSNYELEKELVKVVDEISYGQDFDPYTPLYDLGLDDSLSHTDLCFHLEKLGYDFNKARDYIASHEDVTISSLVTYLNSI